MSKPALLTGQYSQAYLITKQKLLQPVTFDFLSVTTENSVNLPCKEATVLKMSKDTV